MAIYRKTAYTRDVTDMIARMATHHHPREICEALRTHHNMDVTEDSLRATCSTAKISLRMTPKARAAWAARREKEKNAKAPEMEVGTGASAAPTNSEAVVIAYETPDGGMAMVEGRMIDGALRADDIAQNARDESLRKQTGSAMPLSEIGIITKVWPETAAALIKRAGASPHGLAGQVLDEVVKRGLLTSLLGE